MIARRTRCSWCGVLVSVCVFVCACSCRERGGLHIFLSRGVTSQRSEHQTGPRHERDEKVFASFLLFPTPLSPLSAGKAQFSLTLKLHELGFSNFSNVGMALMLVPQAHRSSGTLSPIECNKEEWNKTNTLLVKEKDRVMFTSIFCKAGFVPVTSSPSCPLYPFLYNSTIFFLNLT